MKQIKAFLLFSILCISTSVCAAPLNDFAVLQPKTLNGTDGAYVTSHPDRRLGESIDIGQKVLLEKFSGEGEARLFISNSSEQVELQGSVSGAEGEDPGVRYDSNGDGSVTPIDALLVINHLSRGDSYDPNLDHNGDGDISPLDALLVINALSRINNGEVTTASNPEGESIGVPISNLPGVNIPSLRLVPDADVAAVGTLIMDFDIEQDLTRINFEGIQIDLTNRDGEAFVMNVIYNAPGGAQAEIHIDAYSDETHHSRCVVPLSDDTTGLDIDSEQVVVGVRFEDCTARGVDGGVNFQNVGALVLTLNATQVPGAQILVSRWRTDSATLCNVEDCNLVAPDPSLSPSIPPSPSPSASVSPSANPSVSPSSSVVPSASPSNSPSPSASASPSASPCGLCGCDPTTGQPIPFNQVCGCDQPDECLNCPGDTDPELLDDCDICGGEGKDQCGYCPQAYVGPHHPIFAPAPEGPNKCGLCGDDGLNSCGDCIDDPQAREDLGCGCGQGAPDQCGNCPNTPAGERIPIDECGVCNGPGAADCGVCPGSTGPTQDECGVCGGPGKDECGNCPNDNPQIVKDECGVCGGPGEFECGCDPTIVKDTCGVCGGDDSSCQVCEGKIGVDLKFDNNWGMSTKFVNEIRGLAPSQESSCLNAQVDAAFAACDAAGVSRDSYNPIPGNPTVVNAFDDCVHRYFMGSDIVPGQPSPNAGFAVHTECIFAPDLSVGIRATLGSSMARGRDAADAGPQNGLCSADVTAVGGDYIGRVIPHEGYIFYDENCNPVAPPDEAEQCIAGSIYYNPSPISLLLETDSLDASTISQFPLDGSRCEDCYYEWKASAQAPLLVWDPDASGNITSASQLFGHWTRQGKVTASIHSELPAHSKWKNGYEALGQFDSNFDGKVAGAELQGMRLWFDENRNGVSEAGEVKDLADVGITELYYKSPVKVGVNGDIGLALGYTRIIGDKTVTGASVDWFALGAESAGELIAKKSYHELGISKNSEMPNQTTTVQSSDDEMNVHSRNADQTDTRIEGVWDWRAKRIGISGILMFHRTDNGLAFAGTSLSETKLNENGSVHDAIISPRKLNGSFKNADKSKLRFKVATKYGTVTSEAELISDDVMRGKTIAAHVDGKGGIIYDWIAKKRK